MIHHLVFAKCDTLFLPKQQKKKNLSRKCFLFPLKQVESNDFFFCLILNRYIHGAMLYSSRKNLMRHSYCTKFLWKLHFTALHNLNAKGTMFIRDRSVKR